MQGDIRPRFEPLFTGSPLRKRRFLQALASLPLLAWLGPAAAKAAPALLLAQRAPDSLASLDLGRYLVSEKFDGVRAYWDGHLMFTRQGQVIALPAWFASRLPMRALDGELWMGRNRFDAASAAVRRAQPAEAEWRQLRFMVFELPGAEGSFEQRYEVLRQLAGQAAWEGLQAVPQTRVADAAALKDRLAQVVREGGEGLMLHEAGAPYQTGRSEALLKLKPQDDDEAVVLAHQPGEGKFAGMLGALRVRNSAGQVFLLGTGFSTAQRRAPPPVGATITYRYRGLTATGLPRFASFLRVLDLG